MVPAQVILDLSGDRYTVMFDTGSQITLITKDCAMRLGAKEIGESTLVILGIGNGRALPYKVYEITLSSISGEPVTFRAHSVSELKIEVANYDASVIRKSFPELNVDELVQPTGYNQLLVGSDNAHSMPKEKSRKDKMILYESHSWAQRKLSLLSPLSPLNILLSINGPLISLGFNGLNN